jgi:hypothetical protein
MTTLKALHFSDRIAALAHRPTRVLSDAYLGLFAYGYLTTSERRVLAVERRLRIRVVGVVGRRALMRMMGAEDLSDGSLRLTLAFRRDGGVANVLAVESSTSAGAKRGVDEPAEEALLFSVTRVPEGDPGGVTTAHWGSAELALIDWWHGSGG